MWMKKIMIWVRSDLFYYTEELAIHLYYNFTMCIINNHQAIQRNDLISNCGYGKSS